MTVSPLAMIGGNAPRQATRMASQAVMWSCSASRKRLTIKSA